jgi:hypothetical protein
MVNLNGQCSKSGKAGALLELVKDDHQAVLVHSILSAGGLSMLA